MPRPTIVAATIAAVLLLGACGNTDASEDDVHDILTEAGADEEQADCAARDIADELSQDELNDLAGADTPDDIPNDIDEKVTPILDRCLAEGGPVEEEPEDTGDTDDTTTTVAEDGDTTTTAAGDGATTTTAAAGDTTTTVAGG
jgi:hypothetical protein